MTQTLWLRLREQAEGLGLAVVRKKWPGLGAPGTATAIGVLDLAHEIAHWKLATEQERKLPWYGIGPPVAVVTDLDLDPRLRSPRFHERSDIEHAARHLSLWLMRGVGGSDAEISRRMLEEARLTSGAWYPNTPERVRKLLGELWGFDQEVFYAMLYRQNARKLETMG